MNYKFNLLVTLTLLVSAAIQGQENNEYVNPYFKFTVHKDFQWELNEKTGDRFKWSTVYLQVIESKKFTSAKSYVNAFNKREVAGLTFRWWMDTLGGWPVLRYKTYMKSENLWATDTYVVDNGRQVFLISLMGFQSDSSVVYPRYRETQNSFFFKTRDHGGKGFFINAPQLWTMTKNDYNCTLWTHLPSAEDAPSIPLGIRFVTKKETEQSASEMLKARKKSMKKENYKDLVDSSFTINTTTFIKLTGIKNPGKDAAFKSINYFITANGKVVWAEYSLYQNMGVEKFESSFEKLLGTMEIAK